MIPFYRLTVRIDLRLRLVLRAPFFLRNRPPSSLSFDSGPVATAAGATGGPVATAGGPVATAAGAASSVAPAAPLN